MLALLLSLDTLTTPAEYPIKLIAVHWHEYMVAYHGAGQATSVCMRACTTQPLIIVDPKEEDGTGSSFRHEITNPQNFSTLHHI